MKKETFQILEKMPEISTLAEGWPVPGLGSSIWNLETKIWNMGCGMWDLDPIAIPDICDLRYIMCDLGSEYANKKSKQAGIGVYSFWRLC